MQDSTLDDIDQRLVHALQISPRISWAALAPIIGVDAATLSRRWARLMDEGIVWVTGSRTAMLGGAGFVSALIEIECPPGKTLAIADRLADDAEALSIDLAAGGRDIIVTLATTSQRALGEYVFERIKPLKSIRSMRTQLITQTLADARSWRLRALTEREARLVAQTAPVSGRVVGRTAPELERAIFAQLATDGRMSAHDIATNIGTNPRRVRDAIARLTASKSLMIRTDVARSHTAWPIYTWYFLRVPAGRIEAIGTQLARMDEVRLVVNTVGPNNLIMAVWLHTLQDVQKLEAVIEERMPGVTIADRSVVLRTVKHIGHRLTPDGYAVTTP